MTGVDGGEVGGVLSLSMEGESGLLIAGDDGGWQGGQLVGVMLDNVTLYVWRRVFSQILKLPYLSCFFI